ncbi:kinase-like protein [Xylaria bambusicola]|uniref:kinase-like protein n=1 Tax=Xylaria bambusicola TaxID=326684 RepID=UPI002007A8A4|nr:kinase-like protein [Xylaria bambusicola]KAI0505472.1 kinase-like protein [Xylaria bambusicola]
MASRESRLVAASKLETEFFPRHKKHILPNPNSSQLPAVEQVWEVDSTIGHGKFGVVRLERCRTSSLHPDPSWPDQLRAVKEISKPAATSHRWDYMKELEATIRFSSSQYAPYFVRSHGWFENHESIFIAMEYFSLGDLKRFMDAQPRFSEEATQQIVRQLLKGIRFMHDNNFAHRDLKPGNILVAANSPRWVVKIADFGISKQFMEGGTNLQTHVGTSLYMAPEVWEAREGTNYYSVSVDIWAIGIISAELLLKEHPLPSLLELANLIQGHKPLITDTEKGLVLSEAYRDFVRKLLKIDPFVRLTARSALQHPWLEEEIPDSEDEESLFVTDVIPPRNSLQQQQHSVSQISLPSLAWSNLRLTDARSATQSTENNLLDTYSGPILDSRLLLPSLQNLSLETTRYFVLRSDNPIDIETSAAHDVWTSSQRVNKILDKAWERTDGQVLLFFSVIKSQKFCGIAQMTSAMDWAHTDDHWLEDSWKGRFTLNWLCLSELPFEGVKHVPVKSTTPGFRAISCYDGTEISAPSAFELLKAYTARDREVSQIYSPPPTINHMDIDSVPSSSRFAPSMEQDVMHSFLPQSDGQSTKDRGHAFFSLSGFSTMLRPQR